MISIIVPVYNVEKYLKKCLQSIVNQSYFDIQIIVVDDGSTDLSGQICDQFAMKDNRVKVIHQENQGVVAARKNGITHASGEYIGFVDGDDYIEPIMFEYLHDQITKSDADFIHSGHFKNDGLDIYGVQTNGICEIGNVEEFLINNIFDDTNLHSMPPSNWSKLYKKELIQRAYEEVPEKITFGEDLICLCSCILNSKKVAYINQAFYHYVIREKSASNDINVEHIKRETDLYDSLKELFAKYSLSEKMYLCGKRFYLRNLAICMRKLTDMPIPIYQYQNIENLFDKNIIIYGAGDVGRDYYIQISRYQKCNIVAVVDSNYKMYHYEYVNVISPYEINKINFDLIIVAVLNKQIASNIKEKLKLHGIDEQKILWELPELCI